MSDSSAATEKQLASQGFGQAIVLFFICLALLIFVGVPAQMFSTFIGIPFTLIFCILVPAVVFGQVKRVPLARGLRIRSVDPGVLLGGLFVGMGGWSIAVGIYFLMSKLIGAPIDAEIELGTATDYLMMLLLGAVLPGVCEEGLFRGAIQGVLERKGQWFAIIVAGLLFGLFHLDPWRILPAAFLGMVFGWLTFQAQSLVPAIIAHCANNATALSVAFFFRGEVPIWLIPTLLLLLALGLWMVVRFKPAPPEDLAITNPLSAVPAGVPKLVAWIGGTVVVLLGISVAAFYFLIFSLVTVVTMSDDALLPHIKTGDQLVLIKRGSFAYDPGPGDTVTFQRGEEYVTRVVVRVEDENMILRSTDGSEFEVKHSLVVGKMVQIIPGQGPGPDANRSPGD